MREMKGQGVQNFKHWLDLFFYSLPGERWILRQGIQESDRQLTRSYNMIMIIIMNQT